MHFLFNSDEKGNLSREDNMNEVAEAGRMLDLQKSEENHTMEQRVFFTTTMIMLKELGEASYRLH